MSKKFDKNGNEIIKSEYIVDVDFVDYTAKIKEMVESGMIARYEKSKMLGVYDDTTAEMEEELQVSTYSDVGDIAVCLSTENEQAVKTEEPVKSEEVVKTEELVKSEESVKESK